MAVSSLVAKEALKKVFKKGAKSVASKQLRTIFKESPKKLYRYVDDPKAFLRKGFQPEKPSYSRPAEKLIRHYKHDPAKPLTSKIKKDLIKQGHTRGGAAYKNPGMKWSAEPLPPKPGKTVMEGVKRPGSLTSGTYDPKGKADFVQEYIQGRKVLQQKPGNVLAFVKQDGKYLYRILGATGAVGLGAGAMAPEEAEAGVVSEAFKKVFKKGTKLVKNVIRKAPSSIPDEELVKRVNIPKDSIFRQMVKKKTRSTGVFNMPRIEGPASSTTKRLVGTEYKGSVIEKVTKGQGDHRYLSLENGENVLVDKSFVNKMARKVGTDQYTDKFMSLPQEGQLLQAYKALKLRMAKGLDNKDLVIDYFKNYKAELKAKGVKAPPTYLVESGGKYFTLPARYAKLLQNQGAVKIIKKL